MEPKEKTAEWFKHQKLYDEITMLPNGVDFLLAVNEGIKETDQLREALKELIPIAERSIEEDQPPWKYISEVKTAIENARKLIKP